MTTKLVVVNESDSAVDVYITLGATPGCVQDVAQIRVNGGVHIIKLYPLQGHFKLQPREPVILSAPGSEGFNGNFSFNTPPLNCPTDEFPHGVNLAEFIINNGFQAGGQETVDNSCVCGANAFIEFDLSADDWSTNGGAIPVRTIKNDVWDKNTGLNGVYPYGCDDCTASVAPPSCVGLKPQYVNELPICNVQRDAGNNQGGSVVVKYLGPTPKH